MMFPEQLKYTRDHEWAKIEGMTLTVGVTDHAQSSLGDVVFVELPTVGRILKKGEPFGVIESIKAVSDLFSPVSGKVVAVNSELTQNPSLINSDPHSSAWMIQLEATNPSELGELLNSIDYTNIVNGKRL